MEDTIWTLTVNSGAAIAAAVSAITSAVSATAAFRAIKQNEAIHAREQALASLQRENGRLLDHAVITLERAFNALMGGNANQAFPPKVRINWLTAARLFEEFKATKQRIIDPTLAKECASHEAHWRLQVNLKLRPLQTGEPDYFKQNGPESIQLTSAVILCEFSTWPKGQEDPIDKYKDHQEAASAIGVPRAYAQLRLHLGLHD